MAYEALHDGLWADCSTSPLLLSYFMRQLHWAPCSNWKGHTQSHATHFVKTSLPISLNLLGFLSLSHLVWLTNIHLSKCQEIVLDLRCWLLLHLELTSSTALSCWSASMSPLHYGLLKKQSCVLSVLSVLSTQHYAPSTQHYANHVVSA